MPPPRYATPFDRIAANTVVSQENGMEVRGEWSWCWEWIGRTKLNRTGHRYGVINIRVRKKGAKKGKHRTELVHRYVLRELKGRKLSRWSVGQHLCNNTLCCHPDHLEGGSQSENMQQCAREGRHGNQYKGSGDRPKSDEDWGDDRQRRECGSNESTIA